MVQLHFPHAIPTRKAKRRAPEMWGEDGKARARIKLSREY